MLQDLLGNDTLIEENGHQIVLGDWSQTGRGSHVDFGDDEEVPLEQGRFLGRGSMSDVHEITLQGRKLAHKKILFRRAIGKQEKKEVEILKKLSHIHMLQLIGTYTQRRALGLLLHPVAVCDLHTFFEDVEAWTTIQARSRSQIAAIEALEVDQKMRLKALDYNFPALDAPSKASLAYSKIGCILKAVAYLHSCKIRHKDLKPSNILLGRDQIWLSDFGSATDFSLLSQSATDNERGTPRYFAPEVAAYKPNGRAADIFSLGCVLLEILVLDRSGTLQAIRDNRTSNPSFYANLDKIDQWLPSSQQEMTTTSYNLNLEVRNMLSDQADLRPTIRRILQRASATDIIADSAETSVFGKCCRPDFISREEHDRKILKLEELLDSTRKSYLETNSNWMRSFQHLWSAREHDVHLSQNLRLKTEELEQSKKSCEQSTTNANIIGQMYNEMKSHYSKLRDNYESKEREQRFLEQRNTELLRQNNDLQQQIREAKFSGLRQGESEQKTKSTSSYQNRGMIYQDFSLGLARYQ